MDQQFSLRWNNYLNQITEAFGSLRHDEDLVDVTLSCEGKKLKAHKMLLSACSSYFRDIFKENPCQHPVVVFRNVKYVDLEAIIEFIYKGEVNVVQEQLESFLGTAELLEIKGLTDGSGKDEEIRPTVNPKVQQERPAEVVEPPIARSNVGARSQPPVSFIPTSQRVDSPPLKKRKYSAPAKPPEKQQGPSVSDEPIVPKIEREEYIVEDLTYDEEEDTDLDQSSRTSMQTLDDPKADDSMAFNKNSNILQDQQDSGMLSMGELLLPEPGPSEAVSQESMQDDACDEAMEAEPVEKEQIAESMDKQTTKVNVDEACNSKSAEESKVVLKQSDSFIEDNQSPEPTKPHLQVKKEVPSPLVKPAGKPVAGDFRIPKGLTVTVRPVVKSSGGLDPEPLSVDQSQPFTAVRSEDAKTPVQEDEQLPSDPHLDTQIPCGQIQQGEPEMAEEAPELEAEEVADSAVEEKEPEFDYYGCEVCKAEAKPVDRFNFTHKCPICPCTCFCSHLLKEHMRVIHGWFNVKRTFKQY